jgi:photosynthetic reaction center cytochrome c subunit
LIAVKIWIPRIACAMTLIAPAMAQPVTPAGQQSAPAAGQAQQPSAIPTKVTNLQVLPKDSDPKQVVQIMRGFTRALGVRCTDCHAVADDLSSGDFASDEKPHKNIARQMLRMTMSINDDHLAKLTLHEGHPSPRISCWTCHRGKLEPELVAPPREPQAAPQQPPAQKPPL